MSATPTPRRRCFQAMSAGGSSPAVRGPAGCRRTARRHRPA
ncbi:MAG: hypothetical protein ACK55Z_30310 [bacterium]